MLEAKRNAEIWTATGGGFSSLRKNPNNGLTQEKSSTVAVSTFYIKSENEI
jgi:hypothetical protein